MRIQLKLRLTSDSAEAVYSRLNNIDLMILLYKADVAVLFYSN